jgi:hypothetical protein
MTQSARIIIRMMAMLTALSMVLLATAAYSYPKPVANSEMIFSIEVL